MTGRRILQAPPTDHHREIRSREAAMNEALTIKVRDLIAGHFRISRDRLSDRSRFRDDLKADRLDRLELMIAIEDRLTGLRFDDTVVDDLETVGDLMRVIAGLHAASAAQGDG